MSSNSDLYATMMGSATAGLFGRLVCHPLDTCKTRIQAPPGYGHVLRSTYSVLVKTFKEEGLKGLYRGIGAVTIGGIPATCLYFTSYEISKNYLSTNKWFEKSQFASYFVSGMLAETICCIIFVPVDVIKERMQVQRHVPGQGSAVLYRNSLDALMVTMKHEGLGGIYRGYGATLLSFGPFSALYFTFYEEIKKRMSLLMRSNVDSPSFELSLCSSALAGGLASFITSPLDMAKLRLQVQRQSEAAASLASKCTGEPRVVYSSFLDVLRKTYAGHGGMSALYRGATARVLFHVPNTAISMALFEESRKWWAKYV